MDVVRGFLVAGVVYLLVGMLLGGYMGASDDHSLVPVHAHTNLLGFVLMAIFAAIYRLFPSMADAVLAQYHFWLHQVGTLVLLLLLYLMLADFIMADRLFGIVITIAEAAVIVGVALFGLNVIRHARQ